MPHSIHIELLTRSAHILGGKEKLAARLGVSVDELARWLRDEARTPTSAFLKCLDILAQGERERAATNAGPARDIAAAALSAALAGTAAQRGNVQFADAEGLRIVTSFGFEKPFLDHFALVRHDSASVCGRALGAAQRVVVPDVGSCPSFAAHPAATRAMLEAGARACQSTPLVDGGGNVIAVLSTHYEQVHEPTAKELAALDEIARRAASLLAAA